MHVRASARFSLVTQTVDHTPHSHALALKLGQVRLHVRSEYKNMNKANASHVHVGTFVAMV